MSKGCDKTTAELETKEYFRHPVEPIPIGVDEDIELDIRAL
jgi:hypothetical protein